MPSTAEYDLADGIAVVTLSNPGRANALSNRTFTEELPALIERAGDEARVLIVTGADGAFCAGSELDADGFGDVSRDDTIALLRGAHRVVELIRGIPIPSIAAMDGVAVGAGLGIAASCDLRIASPRTRVSAPYVRMGLTPDMGLSRLLPELVGVGRALELTLTGRMWSAEEGLEAGLLDRVVDDAPAVARELAAAIAAGPAGTVAAIRRMVRSSLDGTLEATLFDVEPAAFADAQHGEEFAERFAAYRASLARKGGAS